MELFRGYVPTRNKECLQKFKGLKNLKTYREVKNLSEFAGILAENVILIDVDDAEQSEKLFRIVDDLQLKCRVYQTTRGKHFFFKNTNEGNGNIVLNNRTKATLACGLNADIKLGIKNSYSILKYKGEEREIIYDIFDDEEYEPVPAFLTPVKTKLNFLEMEAGDGRNQSLFNYILTLQSNGFSVDEARKTIDLINRYVMPDPLDESELNVILRDEAFQKPIFFEKGKFLFDKFSQYLRSNNHIVRLNGQLHIYQEGVYINGSREIESAMIQHIPGLTRAKRAEVLSYLDLLVSGNLTSTDANLIAFKNGVYNVETDELKEFSPDVIVTNKINHNYNPAAYNELADRTLNKLACGDESVRALLEECIGYCFYRRSELRKSFVLTGEKRNGKSTYLAILKALLGDENTAALDLGELGDRFSPASLYGKLANIGDDISDDFISNPAIFKKIASGDWIKGEHKGKDEFFFKPYAKLLFSANNIPRIKDKSGAVLDRLVIIPFDAQFSKDDPDFDPYIKYKLIQEESIEYLITLGIKGLRRVLENQEFTVSEKVQKSIQEYSENNNPILLFFKEDVKIENEPTNSIYSKYKDFCISNNFTPISNIEFSKQVKKHFGVEIKNKSINGKKYRIFTKG